MTSDTLIPPAAVATRTWSAVLFDLDGTIIDSAHDITGSLAHTFQSFGHPVPDAETLRSYVGPPLVETFRLSGSFDEAQAAEAVAVYRAHYADYVLASPVFPGVAGLLERLHSAGVPIALATSKPEHTARAVLENHGLSRWFTEITGADESVGRSSKASVVAEALRRLGERGIETDRAVLVGDRGYDVQGALANDVPAVVVEWGYGSPEESVGAHAIVHSTDQLAKLLLAPVAAA
ncbi:HAD hydrolase-like protein [Agromyces soli]